MASDAQRWARAHAVLDAALDVPADERPALLDRLCAGAPALRAEVEDLLAHATVTRDFLEAPVAAVGPSVADAPADDGALPERIGPYRPVRLLGRGGMGEVFLVERADGLFERRVALKRIRAGLDVPGVARRFEAERRILAGLQHDGIARLLDAGTDDAGRPYFAMDHVEGEPITAYAEARRLDVEARLRLVEQVCEAVHYAHGRLIVHRDLKPSNILVAESDGGRTGGDAPRVRLLDFGIAKLLERDDAEPLTLFGPSPMTRAYAAPEQVAGQPTTTAADVYALGVLLYELLTGTLPYAGATDAQLEQAILTTEPLRPSTRLRSSAEAPPSVDPTRLRGDLDAICLKALEKDPARRYDSAMALADDLRRHRTGQPIAARPPSAGYRLRKYVARHRVGVAMTTAFVIAAVALTAAYTVRLQRALDRAEREAAKAEQVAGFLAGLFEQADPTVARGDTITAQTLLDRGAARLAADLADQPGLHAPMLEVMSRAYFNLGAFAPADSLAEVALALRRTHPDADAPAAEGYSLVRLAAAREAQQRPAESDSLLQRAIALFRAHGEGEALIGALEQRASLMLAHHDDGDAIEALLQEALALRDARYGPGDAGRGLTLQYLGLASHLRYDFDAAQRYFAEAIAVQRQSADRPAELATSLYWLGLIRTYQRDAEAVPLLREAVALRTRVFGRRHVATADALSALGAAHDWLQQNDAALAATREALDLLEDLGQTDTRLYAEALTRYGAALWNDGRPADAVPVYRATLAWYREHLDADSAELVGHLMQLANALRRAGRTDEAEESYREALAQQARAVGTDGPIYGRLLTELGGTLADAGRLDDAEAAYREGVALLQTHLPATNYARAAATTNFGLLLARQGQMDEATPLLLEAQEAFGDKPQFESFQRDITAVLASTEG